MTALETLDDYLGGHLDEPEAGRVEELLFAGDLDAEVGFVLGLSRGLGRLVERGTYDASWSRARVEAALRERRALFVDAGAPPGRLDRAAWRDDAELVLLRLGVDVRGVERLEVTLELDGVPLKTLMDLRGDPDDGAIHIACEPHLARPALDGRAPLVVRISGVRGSGGREIVALYSLRTVDRR